MLTDDVFDDGSSQLIANAHMESMKATVMQYGTQLREIEYALTESLTEFWDANRTPRGYLFEFTDDERNANASRSRPD